MVDAAKAAARDVEAFKDAVIRQTEFDRIGAGEH
jgi:hypothetical protein